MDRAEPDTIMNRAGPSTARSPNGPILNGPGRAGLARLTPLNSPTRYTAPHVSKATPSCYLYSKQSRRPDPATITTRKAKTKNFEAARFDLDRSKRSSSLRSYSSLLSICVSLPGRVDVLRRDSHKYSKREFEYHRKGFSGVDVSRGCDDGVKHRNGFPFSSEGRKSRGWEGLPNASESWFKNGKIPSREIEVQLPPQKKRKYSPIIWDKEEKEVRISSKNRVAPVIPLSSPPPALPRSSGEVPDAVSNGGASKSPVSEIQSQGVEVSEVKPSMADALVGNSQLEAPAGVYTPLQSEKLGDDDQAQNKMDDQEIFHAPNISLSRWASESDSPRDISDDRCSSTPESGEILRVASVGSRSRTSSSDEEGFSVRPGNGDKYYGEEFHDGYMEADEHGGHAVVHQLYSDSEDDVDLSQIEDSPVPRQGSINMLQGCRSVFEYEKLNKINEGTYGVVYRAKDKKTGEIVALKKVKMDVDKGGDGFPMTALREINILLASNHPSIVGVKEVVVDDLDGVFMVMEYMEHDLKGLMESMKHPFSISEAKFLMLQLLGGVKYLHDNWVLHRDLKTSNLLLSKDGELKICDFGLSRQYGSPLKPYTPLVVTLWYRAPEILLGTKQYSTAIDMWSVGCIMAELLAKDALFKGKSEVDQLDKIFRTLGTPNETGWPGLSKLPGFKANYVKQPYNLLRKKFPAASFTGSPVLSDSGFDLLSKLLTYDPEKRITVDAALSHGWFREFPLPRFDYKPTPSSR